MTWRKLLNQKGQGFIKWLSENDHGLNNLKIMAVTIKKYFTTFINTEEKALSFWQALPKVYSCCDNIEIYDKPCVVEAYTYVHFLERYWRMWDTLIKLTNEALLPMGSKGVSVLDIGAGPAPTIYAIQDFYIKMTEYGKIKSLNEFKQNVKQTIIEKNTSMQRMMHTISEYSNRSGPFCVDVPDFTAFNPQYLRYKIEDDLVSEQFDSKTGDYCGTYSRNEIHNISQREARYRFVIFSNFFTLKNRVETYTESVKTIFKDLKAGSVILIQGATNNEYQKLYDDIVKIAQQCSMREMKQISRKKEITSQDKISEIISESMHQTYLHIKNLVKNESLLRKHDKLPDFSNPAGYSIKKDFGLLILRKGR